MLSHYGMNHDNGIYTVAYRVIDISSLPHILYQGCSFMRRGYLERGRIRSASLRQQTSRIGS